MRNFIQCPEVEQSEDILSGQPVFYGTRVPVAALFENLRDGVSIDEFAELFPGVSKKQVIAVINLEAQAWQSHENSI